jgi:hypothetical protein
MNRIGSNIRQHSQSRYQLNPKDRDFVEEKSAFCTGRPLPGNLRERPLSVLHRKYATYSKSTNFIHSTALAPVSRFQKTV